jgi:hypothetical protein
MLDPLATASVRVRAADWVLSHSRSGMELEDLDVRVADLEQTRPAPLQSPQSIVSGSTLPLGPIFAEDKFLAITAGSAPDARDACGEDLEAREAPVIARAHECRSPVGHGIRHM